MFLKFRKGFWFGFRRAGRVREGSTAGFGILGGAKNQNTSNSKLSRACEIFILP